MDAPSGIREDLRRRVEGVAGVILGIGQQRTHGIAFSPKKELLAVVVVALGSEKEISPGVRHRTQASAKLKLVGTGNGPRSHDDSGRAVQSFGGLKHASHISPKKFGLPGRAGKKTKGEDLARGAQDFGRLPVTVAIAAQGQIAIGIATRAVQRRRSGGLDPCGVEISFLIFGDLGIARPTACAVDGDIFRGRPGRAVVL